MLERDPCRDTDGVPFLAAARSADAFDHVRILFDNTDTCLQFNI